MRRKTLYKAKLVITVESERPAGKIKTVSVFDNRTNEFWPEDWIRERGIVDFLNLDDLKETLNWNLNGDSARYAFRWGQSSRTRSTGVAYVFD